MRYVVHLFAGIAENLGQTSINIDSPNLLHPSELKDLIAAGHPTAAEQIHRALVAVNQVYAKSDTEIQETDEIALIPPVGGGSGSVDEGSCRILDEPLDVNGAYQALLDARNGGTVLFVGTVREWTGMRQTTYLTYEAYKEMALAQMRQIEAEVCAKYPEVTPLQWHRVGHLNPTDIAVICGAASPHRDTAFTAARELIERLKKEVPIWKKEFYADGEATWRENQQA